LSYDFGQAIAVDAAGNTYITGRFGQTATFGGSTVGSGADRPQMFLTKLDSAGNFQWARSASVTPTTSSLISPDQGVALDALGNVYVSGTFQGHADFGTITLTNDSPDVYWAKYSSNGTLLAAHQIGISIRWSPIDPPYYTNIFNHTDIAIDSQGDVHFVGAFTFPVVLGSSTLTNAGNGDVFHAKYSPSGGLIWATSAGGRGADVGEAIAADHRGNTFVAGTFVGPANFGGISLTGNPERNSGFLAKYDASGTIVWAREIPQPQSWLVSVTVDTEGNIYAVGQQLPNVGMMLLKFDGNGNLLWNRQIETQSGPYGVTTDRGNDVYVTGYILGSIDFGVTNLFSSGFSDVFVAKFASQGSPVWAKRAGAISYGEGHGLAADANGNVYVTGWFADAATFDSKNITGDSGDIFVAKIPAGSVPPVIVSPPQSLTVIAGTAADLSVAASGLARRYQWLRSGISIPGATNSVFTLTNCQPVDSGEYSVVVSNTYGAVTGVVAVLSVHFSLTVNTSGDGVVFRDPDEPDYPPGSSVILTAEPTPSDRFYTWLGDVTDTSNPLTVLMTTNKVIGAEFVRTVIDILIHGTGAVNQDPYKSSYDLGEQVTVTALPGRWWKLAEWSDGLTDAVRIVTIGRNNFYGAFFSATTDLETLTFGNGTRTAPVGMPAVFVNDIFCTDTVTNFSLLGHAEVSMLTTFTNGIIFYTLDGSKPGFESMLYTGPFVLRHSALIRAAAYDANFSAVWEADTVHVEIEPAYTVNASSPGGGTVSIVPDISVYEKDQWVTLMAESQPGWEFLQWLGDVQGRDATVTVQVTHNLCAEAIFGTAITNVVAGGGLVALDPSVSLYPFGTRVRMTAVPTIGNYFALWGNAASGTNNPLPFTVTNAGQTVSAAFTALPTGQAALTVLISGHGRVATPRANRYAMGQMAALRAIADAGQEFLGWSGDASGGQTNIAVVMNQSRVITADFTARPRLSVEPCGGGWIPDGFRMRLTGDFGVRYEMQSSSNAAEWFPFVAVTNDFGMTDILDPSGNTGPKFYRAKVP
jgi:hypothetical protein